ncbi:MAG: carboxypeptidase-like regulatory domain-containing protein [Candidatus Thermoplasmatota archaeon]|nr:carboxypeptidase-like regulatory domain-containing protein [Candidatus Thermoplasmatota archaeon]
MGRYVVLMVCALLFSLPAIGLAISAPDITKSRGLGPDLRVVINVPENGGRYQKELGLYVNVTVFNDGDDMGLNSANLTMIIKTLDDGIVVLPTLPRVIKDLTSGENITFTYQNWTGMTPGRFVCNASVIYPDDINNSNDHVQHTFSVWSDYYPFPPKFETGSVSELKGDTGTRFTYNVEYKFNKYPDSIKVEIDGQNHSMVEDDPMDDVPEDGKKYTFNTTLSIGNHRHRFFGEVSGYDDPFASPANMSLYHVGPWVNISLKDERISPFKGYVTTDFLFTVAYGSNANLPPDRIYITANDVEYNMTRSSPTPNYQSGNVEFKTRVKGMKMIPSPITYGFHVRSGPDQYSIGPFIADGPRMDKVTLNGTITDLKGVPLEGVNASLDPGSYSITNDEGMYSIESYVGRGFDLSFSREGYISRSYDVDLDEDWNINTELERLPIGGTLQGVVRSGIEAGTHPLEGATVNLSGPDHTFEVATGADGRYVFSGIPAGDGYSLKFMEYRHRTRTLEVDIKDGEVLTLNITLPEKDIGISLSPDPDDTVAVQQVFLVSFPSLLDITTLSVVFFNSTGTIPGVISGVGNTTDIEIWPANPLNYNENYTLLLEEGVLNITGELILWRDLTWSIVTMMQPLGEPAILPPPDSENVPLDTVIEISFGIGIESSSFSASIYNMDEISGALSCEVEFTDLRNWSDSGRTDTIVRLIPANLTYYSRYSVEISQSLRDRHGRNVLSSPLEFGFITEREPDSDNDGVPNSEDLFPDDPDEWSDMDKDGIGDNSDMFPTDPDEWIDTDGDGIGDNSDTDDDGDGMPDQWELDNGLNPLDPGDAFVDSDEDGAYNIDEFLKGTDPNDKGSSPEDEESNSLWIIIAAVALIAVVVIVGVLFLTGKIGPGKGSRSGKVKGPFEEE